MNADNELFAFIGGSQLFIFSSVVPAVPSWFNPSPRISLATLGVLGG